MWSTEENRKRVNREEQLWLDSFMVFLNSEASKPISNSTIREISFQCDKCVAEYRKRFAGNIFIGEPNEE